MDNWTGGLMSTNNVEIVQSLLDVWARWQRRPQESATSESNLKKSLGVLAALYAYHRLNPKSENSKPVTALLALAALSGLAIPAKDEVEEKRKLFGVTLAKLLLINSNPGQEAVLDWYNTLGNAKQGILSQLFGEENPREVLSFLGDAGNRNRICSLLEKTEGYFTEDRVPSIFDAKESNVTIDKGARINLGFFEMVGNSGKRCVVITPSIRIEVSREETITIPTSLLSKLAEDRGSRT